MSPRGWKVCIQDILDAIEEIQVFTQGMNYETFRNDAKTIRAVELNFIVIGEAASQIPDDVQESHPHIPWHFMRGIRNRLVHGYFSVDPRLIWDTILNDLPELARSLSAILTERE